jgi:CDP-glycerol glycerophosphotransferase (TagB/SpsB family)
VIRRIYFYLQESCFRIFLLILNTFILLISFFIPKTNKIIVVGSWFGNRFADNSKHFFLYANEYKEELGINKIVWITRNPALLDELSAEGFCVYKLWSLKSIWYHLRARIHIVDQAYQDINSFFSVRSIRINLWHGFPLKRIGAYKKNNIKQREEDRNPFYKFLRDYSIPGFWGRHYLLATSKFSAGILGNAFSISKEKVLISGYPRNYEPILDNPIKYVPKNEKDFMTIVKKTKKDSTIIIGYFPTFRDNRDTYLFGTKDTKELKGIFDYFQSSNIKILSKFHAAGSNKSLDTLSNHEAFINLPSDVDVYTFLSEIDILVTDYSSIYFDFLLWEKPIIFFPYDLEYYRDKDRGLIFNYENFTPGPKIYNVRQFEELFSNGVNNFLENYFIQYHEQHEILKNKIYGSVENMDIIHLLNEINTLNERIKK